MHIELPAPFTIIKTGILIIGENFLLMICLIHI
jgi:hypothetical protein